MRQRLTVIVIGLGNFGSYMARTLNDLGHTVIAIDKDEDRVQSIGRGLAKAVAADISNKEIYKTAGVEDADFAVVSLGHRIDLSAIATLHLKELRVKEIWVKVISEDHAELMRLIGATRTIFPEKDTAERLAHGLHHPNIVDRVRIAEDFGILEFYLPDSLAGKSLIDLDLRREFKVNVIAVYDSDSDESHLNPDPMQPLAKGDVLFVLGLLEDLEKFQDSLKQ